MKDTVKRRNLWSVCLLVHPSVHPSVVRSLSLSVSLYVFMSVCVSVCLPVCLSAYMHGCVCVCVCVCMRACVLYFNQTNYLTKSEPPLVFINGGMRFFKFWKIALMGGWKSFAGNRERRGMEGGCFCNGEKLLLLFSK